MKKSVVERFWAKVTKTETCWHWTASKSSTGYGTFKVSAGKTVNAHRFAYVLTRGEVPEGLQLDHLCRNRACCNPSHLEPVTQQVNIRRGVAPTNIAAATNVCRRGLHLIEGDNEYIRPSSGYRLCRACQSARLVARKQAA